MRQQLAELTGLERRKPRQDILEISVGAVTVELGGLDQAGDGGGSLAGEHGAGTPCSIHCNYIKADQYFAARFGKDICYVD